MPPNVRSAQDVTHYPENWMLCHPVAVGFRAYRETDVHFWFVRGDEIFWGASWDSAVAERVIDIRLKEHARMERSKALARLKNLARRKPRS